MHNTKTNTKKYKYKYKKYKYKYKKIKLRIQKPDNLSLLTKPAVLWAGAAVENTNKHNAKIKIQM